MHDEDCVAADLIPSATGILECLRMLADEAAELQLGDTLHALNQAIAVCELERGRGHSTDPFTRAPELPVSVH